MPVDKVDRRVRYTKQALRESMIKLIKVKPIEKISVKELCELADINRSTFYVHYDSPTDLLDQIKSELLVSLNEYLEEYNFFKEYEEASLQKVTMIFEYVIENAELCQILLGGSGDVSLQKTVMTIVQKHGIRAWRTAHADVDPVAVEYMLAFGINGGIGVLQKWLDEGLVKSAREIAEMVISFTFSGLSSIVV
ncbi:MAG: TetR family transcriptional regulator C-terminal domain-containing protein [Oscillospiraceae bacterium]|jgi:AcrR family transcriptional regulator|nr:TetR family transcriptional regulator C-terminal domain-containing protein [Oscillospiraceae bacterium]